MYVRFLYNYNIILLTKKQKTMANKFRKSTREEKKKKAVQKKQRPQTEYQRTRDMEKRRRKKGHNGIFDDLE